MPRLYQLPNGNWIDLKWVMALQAYRVGTTQCHLKVVFRRTNDGFVHFTSDDFAKVCKVRDDVAAAVNALDPANAAFDLMRQRQKLSELEAAYNKP